MARNSLDLVSRNGLTWLESPALSRLPWLAHGFSTRLLQRRESSPIRRRRDFNLGLTADAQPRAIEANRQHFYEELGFSTAASLRQVHSDLIYQATGGDAAAEGDGSVRPSPIQYMPGGYPAPGAGASCAKGASPAGDALLTAEPGILLTIRIADCLPVLIVDTRRQAIAAIHAGWRGALARIVEKAAGDLRRIFNSNPKHQLAVLGPSIGRCCYEVGEEVVEAFDGQFLESDSFFSKPSGRERPDSPDRYTFLFHSQAPPGHARPRSRLHLDLKAVARAQLMSAGLKASAIHDTGCCTACRADLFFSHRREGARAGRMMAAIGIRGADANASNSFPKGSIARTRP